MNWIKKITHSGISEEDPSSLKREVLLTNYISLILCTSVLILFIYWLLFIGDFWIIKNLLIGFLLFLLPVVLNRLGYTKIGRLYICYLPVIYLWFMFINIINRSAEIQASLYDGLRIYLLSLSIIPYLLFERKDRLIFFMGIIPTLFSFLLFEKLMYFLDTSYYQLGNPGDDYELMRVRSLVAYFIINGGCLIFQSIIAKNDALNRKLVKELKEKSEEIESQNDELLRSHEELNRINSNLEKLVEEKTESIRLQQEKLLKYAHSNAHHVRGPIARLLGLIQLLKIDRQANYTWFFKKVEHEAKDIDEITRSISHDLDEAGIHSEDARF